MKGVNGILKNGEQLPKNSFAMKRKELVEAESCTGYFAQVMREIDNAER